MTPENTIVVYNKIDILQSSDLFENRNFSTVRISALHGNGLQDLESAITQLAESFQIQTGEDVVTINARHALCLKEAIEYLEAAGTKLRDSEHSELVASDLRGSLEAFGQISGKIDNERMLDQLFATFCIGK